MDRAQKRRILKRLRPAVELRAHNLKIDDFDFDDFELTQRMVLAFEMKDYDAFSLEMDRILKGLPEPETSSTIYLPEKKLVPDA